MNNAELSVVIAGGGTAGHIEPALAVGEALKTYHGARITALGTKKGLEGEIVPARGVDLRMILPVPIPRKPSVDLVKLPYRLIKAVLQTRAVLKDVNAQAVFGTGGYVAAPAYIAAKTKGLPFYIHETNALAGMANKLGVKLGGVGFNAAANSGMPGDVVGVPIRAEIGKDPDGAAAARGRQQWGFDDSKPVLLITGGSQGAASINAAVKAALPELVEHVQVLHAYGPRNEAPQAQDGYVPVPYIEDMAAALAVADLTVCRSGAMTVAEITAAGLPAIYVPLPHGNGEQALNSQHVFEAGGAIMIKDSDLTGQRLVEEVVAIADNPQRREEMVAAAQDSGAGDVSKMLEDRIAADVRKEQEKESN